MPGLRLPLPRLLPRSGAKTPWQERVAIIRDIAEKISDNSLDLSSLMVFEVGKSRLEALGEVEETADLLRYYANAMEKNQGYINEMGKLSPDDPGEHNYSVLCPYGVWVVISPFNFPMALSAAPIAAALVSGNTIVFKGSSRHALRRLENGRTVCRSGTTARRVQLCEWPGPDCRPGIAG